jgi:hypothetical protein
VPILRALGSRCRDTRLGLERPSQYASSPVLDVLLVCVPANLVIDRVIGIAHDLRRVPSLTLDLACGRRRDERQERLR